MRFLYGTDRLFFQNSSSYDSFTAAYWSNQQGDVEPRCVFKPAKAADVSVLVLLSRLTQCPFAVKSGGHAAFAGASNSPGGITVWLRDLDAITLNKDKTIASVGPGNVWSDVYAELESDGLAVIGGRVSNIGVGGLTTGGGISYHSNLYGWALDNVDSYEVRLLPPVGTFQRLLMWNRWSPHGAPLSPPVPPGTRISTGRCAAAVTTSAS